VGYTFLEYEEGRVDYVFADYFEVPFNGLCLAFGGEY
jgi:hypothetical protein